ncbi:hypothetical protein M8818_002842 [Zalaria obscura]|uniref:Uncharacterized protein n=1 Tax=Zalaria obscura TaxID=2024903 RepID=A0ACC3SH19_9PEZI
MVLSPYNVVLSRYYIPLSLTPSPIQPLPPNFRTMKNLYGIRCTDCAKPRQCAFATEAPVQEWASRHVLNADSCPRAHHTGIGCIRDQYQKCSGNSSPQAAISTSPDSGLEQTSPSRSRNLSIL